jgi:hypothetical protein
MCLGEPLVAFGSIEIDRRRHEHDVVIDRGDVRKRIKKPSNPLSHLWPQSSVGRRGHPVEREPADIRHGGIEVPLRRRRDRCRCPIR